MQFSSKSFYLFLVFLTTSLGAFAQEVIWQDNFDSYSNGTVTGSGSGFAPTTWSSANGVDIRGKKIQSTLRNSNGRWRIAPINITGFTNLTWDFITSTSNVESTDRFSARYRLNGGSWETVISTVLIPEPSYSLAIPSGSTLELEIRFSTNENDDKYEVDNVVLRGDLPPCDSQLDYEFYDLIPTGNTINNIPKTGALETGQINTFNVNTLQSTVDPTDADTYSIRYSGYVHIPNSGAYTFYTSSDDGSSKSLIMMVIMDCKSVRET